MPNVKFLFSPTNIFSLSPKQNTQHHFQQLVGKQRKEIPVFTKSPMVMPPFFLEFTALCCHLGCGKLAFTSCIS